MVNEDIPAFDPHAPAKTARRINILIKRGVFTRPVI
jgi:hypothetical protein